MVDNDAYFGHVLANAPSVGAFVLLDGPAAESPYCGIPSLSIQGNPEGVNPAAFEGVLCSTPPVQAGFARCGFINVKKDPDGLLRRLPLLARHGEKWCPSIGLAALLAADPRAALEFERDAWGPVLRVGDSRVPMDQHARVLLRFARTLNAIPVLSAVDILAGRLDPEAVRDRLVLIGSSASGLGDLHRTAVLPVLPGIAAHAVLLENIASGSHYRQPEWKRTYAMIVTLLAATAVLGFFLLTGAGTATVGICTTLVLFPAIGAMSFLFNGIVLPAVAPVIAALSLLVFLTGSFYAVEKRLARARGLRMVLLKQAMLELMVDLAESRDLETGEHIKRTQLLVKVLAEGLAAGGKYPGLNAYVIELLYTCAPLHDVGKIVVPDRILRKPGPLDEEEFALMQEHVVYGERIIEMLAQRVQGDEVLDFALALVATHHENWDGTGYPEGLAGEEIPLSGRIMALADVYDALTSERVYKERLSHAEARKIIVSETGTKFDPEVVRAFLAQEDKIKALLGRSDHPADNPRVSNPV
jgi:adenylate cyclase